VVVPGGQAHSDEVLFGDVVPPGGTLTISSFAVANAARTGGCPGFQAPADITVRYALEFLGGNSRLAVPRPAQQVAAVDVIVRVPPPG
jgi:hypothetical protein